MRPSKRNINLLLILEYHFESLKLILHFFCKEHASWLGEAERMRAGEHEISPQALRKFEKIDSGFQKDML